MIFKWSKAYFKRYFMRPSMLILLAVMLALSFVFTFLSKGEASGFPCGVLSSQDENVNNIIASLEGTLLNVNIYDDEEEMLSALKRGEIRYAYAFDDEFSAKYEKGERRNTIIRFSNPDDVFASLIDEIVFSKVLSVCSEMSIESFLSEKGVSTINEALVYFDSYNNTLGDVFEYEILSQDKKPSEASAAFPVRGVMSVLVMAVSLFTLKTLLTDEERGLFKRLSDGRKNIVRLIAIFVPTCVFILALLLALIINGTFTALYIEVLSILLLLISCTSCAYFISSLMKNADSVALILPASLLFSLALCPVFFDVSSLFSPMKYVSALLPPYCYIYASGGDMTSLLYGLGISILYFLGGKIVYSLQGTKRG
ncbi:MAG: ABC transporter permease [Clostridia bacterium]|nr:ABC transporter permease [Clostridia bacterium]